MDVRAGVRVLSGTSGHGRGSFKNMRNLTGSDRIPILHMLKPSIELTRTSRMDRFILERSDELAPDEEDVQKQLIAGEGDKHDRAYLGRLVPDGVALLESDRKKDFSAAAADTLGAIRSKTPVIYQAALQAGNFAGSRTLILCR